MWCEIEDDGLERLGNSEEGSWEYIEIQFGGCS